MSWKCPECKATIDYLRYVVPTSGTEYGRADLIEEKPADSTTDKIADHECDDSESGDWDGDVRYECPDCDAEIDRDDLEWCEEDEDDEEEVKEEELEELTHRIIAPQSRCIMNESKIDTSIMMICKNLDCKHILNKENDYGDSFCECPKCGTVTGAYEYNGLLASGYFN